MNYQTAYGNATIIPNEALHNPSTNGRVLVEMTPENNDVRFKMMERIAVKNIATPYTEAIKGLWEDTIVTKLFFSAENIQIIQNAIRAEVYTKTKYITPPPNIEHLKTIMRSKVIMFYQYDPDINTVTSQIERLNKIVIDESVKFIVSASHAHMQYLKDQSSMAMPLVTPLNHDRNYKQLELPQWL